MKKHVNKRKILISTGITVFGSLMVVGSLNLKPSTSLGAKEVLADDQTFEAHTGWYDMTTDVENRQYNLFISPLPGDYKNSFSISSSINGK